MILLIGYGSTLRGDDGIGQIIARRFDGHLYGEALQVISCHQLTPDLVEPVSRADRVIFVDASEVGSPGEIRRTQVVPAAVDGAFTHNVNPASLLATAADWYGVHRHGEMVSVTGRKFDYSETLSPEVEASISDAMNLIARIIESALVTTPM